MGSLLFFTAPLHLTNLYLLKCWEGQISSSQERVKVLQTAVAKQAEHRQAVDSALRGQKSFPSVYFAAPYMEVLDWELGLSVCLSQTYTTVCISQLTWGLMLQCFGAPELLLTKPRLKSVFVTGHVCLRMCVFPQQKSYMCALHVMIKCF